MDHRDIYREAIGLLKERGEEYGDVADVFQRACGIYNLTVGGELTPWQAAMFMSCLKMARMRGSPNKLDHYVDIMNYQAFAGEFAEVPDKKKPDFTPVDTAIDELDANIKEIVSKFGLGEDKPAS